MFLTEFILVSVMLAYVSDRYKARAIPVASVCLLSVVGYAMFLGSTPFFFSICPTQVLIAKQHQHPSTHLMVHFT